VIDYIKIQQKLLRDWADPITKNGYWTKCLDGIAVGTSSHFIFIPDSEFLLDTSKTTRNHLTEGLLEYNLKIKEHRDYGNWYKTSNQFLTTNDRKKWLLVELANENGTSRKWFDSKFIEQFGEDCCFKSTNSPTSPVIVYEGDRITGLVMPVDRRKD